MAKAESGKKSENAPVKKIAVKPSAERRKFVRLNLPASAYAVDSLGNELGNVTEASGGGLQLHPASPMARLAMRPGQRLVVTIVEPGTDNRTEMPVEVRYIRSNSIGLLFL